MIREKNPLLKLTIKNRKSRLFEFYNSNSESLYELFYLIMENSIENFWYECINILLSYIQLIAYLFDPTVSNY